MVLAVHIRGGLIASRTKQKLREPQPCQPAPPSRPGAGVTQSCTFYWACKGSCKAMRQKFKKNKNPLSTLPSLAHLGIPTSPASTTQQAHMCPPSGGHGCLSLYFPILITRLSGPRTLHVLCMSLPLSSSSLTRLCVPGLSLHILLSQWVVICPIHCWFYYEAV